MKRTITLALASLVAGSVTMWAADVKENWEKHCAKCHGTDGKGATTMGKKLKIKDYTDPKVQESMKDDEIIKITKEGKKEGDKTLMKGFSDVMKDDEIKAMVDYIRKFKK